MPTTTEAEVLEVLRSVKDPDLGRDIVELGFVKNLKIEGEKASFTIELTTPACPVREKLKEEARRAVLSLPGVKEVDVDMTARVRPSLAQQKAEMHPQDHGSQTKPQNSARKQGDSSGDKRSKDYLDGIFHRGRGSSDLARPYVT